MQQQNAENVLDHVGALLGELHALRARVAELETEFSKLPPLLDGQPEVVRGKLLATALTEYVWRLRCELAAAKGEPPPARSIVIDTSALFGGVADGAADGGAASAANGESGLGDAQDHF